MILAVVGTREFANLNALRYARALIRADIACGRWDSFVTGDAPGIDSLAAAECRAAGMPCEVLSPEERQWNAPRGFRWRNGLIVAKCDELLAIRDPGSRTYGSGWTAEQARIAGKPVTEIQIH